MLLREANANSDALASVASEARQLEAEHGTHGVLPLFY